MVVQPIWHGLHFSKSPYPPLQQASEEKNQARKEKNQEECARARADRLQTENEKLKEQLAARPAPRGKLEKSAAALHAQKFADELDQYHNDNVVSIWAAALRIVQRRRSFDFRAQLVKSIFFKPVVTQIEVARDVRIGKYLSTNVYPHAAFSLSRLLVNLSKRECQLMNQMFKHDRRDDGSKTRWKLCEGSKVAAPELFSLAGINEIESESIKETGVTFEQSDDKWSATVAGAPFSVDVAIFNMLASTETSRVGGLATKGTRDDPFIVVGTGDGAGLSNAFSGVRCGVFPGSTNYLAQSSRDVTTLFMFKAEEKAEEWPTLGARMGRVRPQLGRIWRTGELMPHGRPSGIFVKFVLSADKPFMRHVNGLRSHNHNHFGAPFCSCTDVQLFDLSKCKRTHYGQISYEMLCNRAHVPLWLALGEPEPAEWSMTCDCCKQV